MLRTINELLESLRPARRDAPPAAQEHALQLATAVLLVEVMRAEAGIGAAERAAALQALERKFALSADERETLLARVSGSGATCFAICASDIEADALAARVDALRPDWWTVRCRLGGPWPDA